MFSKIRHKFTNGNKSNFFHIIPALFVCCKDTKKETPFRKIERAVGKNKTPKEKTQTAFYFISLVYSYNQLYKWRGVKISSLLSLSSFLYGKGEISAVLYSWLSLCFGEENFVPACKISVQSKYRIQRAENVSKY